MNTAKAKRHSTRTPERVALPSQGNVAALIGRALCRALLFALVLALLLSLPCTLIALSADDPNALILPLALTVLAFAATVCGFVMRRGSRLSPLVCGALGGLGLLALWFALSCLLPDHLRGSLAPPLVWGLRGGVMLFCLLGAAMGANLPRGRRSRRKRS